MALVRVAQYQIYIGEGACAATVLLPNDASAPLFKSSQAYNSFTSFDLVGFDSPFILCWTVGCRATRNQVLQCDLIILHDLLDCLFPCVARRQLSWSSAKYAYAFVDVYIVAWLVVKADEPRVDVRQTYLEWYSRAPISNLKASFFTVFDIRFALVCAEFARVLLVDIGYLCDHFLHVVDMPTTTVSTPLRGSWCGKVSTGSAHDLHGNKVHVLERCFMPPSAYSRLMRK